MTANRTWTLDAMRNFVLGRSVDIRCLSCNRGTFTFLPILVIYPECNSDNLEMEAQVGVDVMLDRQSCFCKSLTEQEAAKMQKEAHDKIHTMFVEYLSGLPVERPKVSLSYEARGAV